MLNNFVGPGEMIFIRGERLSSAPRVFANRQGIRARIDRYLFAYLID